METDRDTADEIAEYLFTRLVTGDFTTAIQEAESQGSDLGKPLVGASLAAEVESALLTRHILQPGRAQRVCKCPVPSRAEPPYQGEKPGHVQA
jgi:hypothetical protein